MTSNSVSPPRGVRMGFNHVVGFNRLLQAISTSEERGKLCTCIAISTHRIIMIYGCPRTAKKLVTFWAYRTTGSHFLNFGWYPVYIRLKTAPETKVGYFLIADFLAAVMRGHPYQYSYNISSLASAATIQYSRLCDAKL